MGASVPIADLGLALMSSRGKKKTTMAKMQREARLRDRRSEKAAKKEARREVAAHVHDVAPEQETIESSEPQVDAP